MTRSKAHLTTLCLGLLSLIGFGLSCFSLGVNALTLAGIEVQSHKGEPLLAEILVSSSTVEEWGQLVVKLAPAERFSQLGLVFTPAVGQLQVELLETTDGSKRIRLFSPQAFSDNFVDLLIEAQTASGKWVKAFTLMLKPAPVKVDAPVQLPQAASAQGQAQQAPTEHVVQKGESASQIIQKSLSEDMSVGQAMPHIQNKLAESGSGILNLNRLLDAPHKNAYLWAALTLLGVLAVWAGLRIQSRKTSNTLSTLIPSEDIGKSAGTAPQSTKTKLPANIAALDLNLDLNPQVPNKLGSFRSPGSTETLQ